MAHAAFGGKIGDDWRDSEPWWPPVPTPPDGAPNVVLVVLDDVGFAQLGCYGSDIDTPVIDGLAADGIRLTNFHTTALCSPTRACLLTGRNHHRSGMGRVADLAIGFPGYWGRPPRENGFLSEILRANGYATYAVGKWHLSPEDETNMAASRATWPLGRGFDRWYGFHGGETHQFVPALYHDNHCVRPPRAVEDGYHLSADLADRAIEFLGDLRAVDAELPVLPLLRHRGLPLAPPRAARVDRALPGPLRPGVGPLARRDLRPPARPRHRPRGHGALAASALGPELGHASTSGSGRWRSGSWSASPPTCPTPTTQIGRAARLHRRPRRRRQHRGHRRLGQRRQLRGRQGGHHQRRPAVELRGCRASTEMYRRIDEIGGPLSHNNYPWGWTMAGNTPFKRWKREVHEGGVADPCIVRLPASRRTGAGGVRRQYAHAIDVLPTVLELVGIDPPAEIDGIAQSHLDGISFAYVLGAGGADEPGRHRTQHFEMLGSRAIYHDGWKAVTYHPVGPIYDDGLRASAPFDDDVWELYHVAEDVSEVHDRAAEFPEKVAELVSLWWEEARRNDVLPLDNRVLEAVVHKHDRRRPQQTYRYFQGGAQVPEWVAVDVRNRSHRMSVTVEVPDGVVPSGVLLALGCALGGWSLHVLDGRLRYVHNLHGQRLYAVTADDGPRFRPAPPRVPVRQGRRRRRAGCPRRGWPRRGGDRAPALHAGRLQRGRHRAHLRLRVGARGGRRLQGAVRLQRHHRPRRGHRHRPSGA